MNSLWKKIFIAVGVTVSAPAFSVQAKNPAPVQAKVAAKSQTKMIAKSQAKNKTKSVKKAEAAMVVEEVRAPVIVAVAASDVGSINTASSGGIPAVAENKIISGKIALENGQNLYQDYNQINATELTLWPSFKLGENTSLSMLAVVSQDHVHARNTSLSNTSLNLSLAKFHLANDFTWSPSLSAALPTDEGMRKSDSFQGSVGAGSLFVRKKEGSPLEFAWALAVVRNIHEYNLSAEGGALLEYTLKNRIVLEYFWTERWSTSWVSDYIVGSTYGQNTKTKFANALDLNFEFAKNWIANAGVSTDGDAKKYDGVQSNFSFFNENTSVLRLGVTYAL